MFCSFVYNQGVKVESDVQQKDSFRVGLGMNYCIAERQVQLDHEVSIFILMHARSLRKNRLMRIMQQTLLDCFKHSMSPSPAASYAFADV